MSNKSNNEQSLTNEESAVYLLRSKQEVSDSGPYNPNATQKQKANYILTFFSEWLQDANQYSLEDKLLCLKEMFSIYIQSSHADDKAERLLMTFHFEQMEQLLIFTSKLDSDTIFNVFDGIKGNNSSKVKANA